MPASSRKKLYKHRRQSQPWRWNHIHLSVFLLTICLFLSVLITASLYALIALHIPDISSLSRYNPPAATIIFDRDGREIGSAYLINRRLKTLKELPPLLPKAFIAAEDARFYSHPGVDGWSILRALVHNIRSGGRGQGGSTITQQVARALLLSPEKTYIRKLKEAILAYRMDKALGKNEILHIYLNQIYLGERSYGVGAAAMTYFHKPVEKLNLAEISILAGLPQAPSSYSPLTHFHKAKIRQAYVLNRMAEDGYITDQEARKAFAAPLSLQYSNNQQVKADYFVQDIKNYIKKRYGDLLTTGGLRVYTSLDSNLQNEAVMTLRHGLNQLTIRQNMSAAPLQGALIAIDNQGMVRALVGGNNFQASQFDRATQAKRQPGSAFKPIIYAAALEAGFAPNSIIDDAPIEYKNENGVWRPKNFSGRFFGPTTLRNGLIHSRNIVAIKLLREVGLQRTIRLARSMGIKSPLKANLSLALGSSAVSLLELTNAYRVFAQAGKFQPPIFINKIIDRHDSILEQNHPRSRQVMSPETAFQMVKLMQGVIKNGTGHLAQGIPYAAGKTGTTNHNMDAWFIGFTPRLCAGVWVGHDRYKSLGLRGTGGRAAAPIWHDFMQKATDYRSTADFKAPAGITFIPIDRQTGNFEYLDPNHALWEAFKKKNMAAWQHRHRQQR
ncbi:penicillin-binding protein 1A [Desulfobacterota bacterium M19]